MFNHKHYVPIIKSKAGELWTLKHLKQTSKKHLTPFVEILGHKNKAFTDHAVKICDSLSKGWGIEHRVFIDTIHLGIGSAVELHQTFVAVRDSGLLAVPVTSLGRSPQYQNVILKIVNAQQRGFCLRLNVRDFGDSDVLKKLIDGLLGLTGMKPSTVDVVIDYERRMDSSELRQLIRVNLLDLPYMANWRSLTVAAGSFPNSLMNYPAGQWSSVPRADWLAWIATVKGSKPPSRLPAFGDYGIRDPGAPADFGTPSVNLRYTSDEDWIVRRGALVKNGGASEMPTICRSLMNREEWCGADFSDGDSAIEATAANSNSPGNATQWVQWCMNHHCEFVVDQMQSDNEL